MRRLAVLPALLALGLAAAGCGDDEQPAATSPATAPAQPAAQGPATTRTAPAPRTGTRIVLGDSEFGSMLFDARRQAIYVFENDLPGQSVCYGECAEAWPPVHTRGEPRAGRGVRQSLLGTVRRRDGRLQVTYAGKPLYFYAHESPGEVRCHDVNLNGGLWWVVGPDGRRRA